MESKKSGEDVVESKKSGEDVVLKSKAVVSENKAAV